MIHRYSWPRTVSKNNLALRHQKSNPAMLLELVLSIKTTRHAYSNMCNVTQFSCPRQSAMTRSCFVFGRWNHHAFKCIFMFISKEICPDINSRLWLLSVFYSYYSQLLSIWLVSQRLLNQTVFFSIVITAMNRHIATLSILQTKLYICYQI